MQPGKLSKRQGIFLLIPFVLSTDVLIIPGAPLQLADHGAWLSSLLATGLGLTITFFITKLISWEPHLLITERFRLLLGKRLGTLISAMFVYFILFSYILILREGSELVRISFLADTPLTVIMGGLTLLALYGALLGIETISRFNILVFPFFFLSFIILFLSSLAHPDWTNLAHPLENGLHPVLAGSIAPLSWLCELIVLWLVVPDLNLPKKETFYFPFFITFSAGLLMTLNIITIQISLGANLGQQYTFPILEVGRSLFSRESLRGLDALLMTIWVMGLIAKLSFLLYYGLHELSYIVHINDMKNLLLPTGILFHILGMASIDNIKELENVTRSISPFVALGTYEGVFPILLFPLILRHLRRQGGV